jgi:type I restriction enzyme R subunit
MRSLIDNYIEADAPRTISNFENMGLLELIVKSGIGAAINSLPDGIKKNQGAVAETIANNVRSKIIKEHLNDPAYYDRMSVLLDEVIAALKAKRIDYAEYLKQIAEIARKTQTGMADDTPERLKKSPALRALYNNLGHNEDLAIRVDETVRRTRPDGWRGITTRENVIKEALLPLLGTESEVERVFLIITAQKEY